MAEVRRQIYVISDLHLGGVYPTTSDPEDRGFRICTHVPELTRFIDALTAKPGPLELVINGDLIDFLAEQDTETGASQPFLADQGQAVAGLDAICTRDQALFDALNRLLEKGHRLTILLGNHDIELALPRVRQRLADRMRVVPRHDYQFLYDGEAYAVANLLIEHGNRYDMFNVVDHDGLRRVRSLLSRGQEIPAEYAFTPPAGSQMVAEVINPIKRQYRFIDLLKPENDCVVPILLALEPGFRRVLMKVAELSIAARKHRVASAAMPSFGGDITSTNKVDAEFGSDISAPEAPPPDALTTVLASVMTDPSVVLAAGTESGDSGVSATAAGIGSDISAMDTIDRALGLARLLTARDDARIDRRLPALLAAIRSLQQTDTFARNAEASAEYVRAALDLSLGGFDYVVFGHTHVARDMWLSGGGRYLNCGSWSDLIKFPKEILSGSQEQALAGVRAFIEDLRTGKLAAWTSFQPTYVLFDVGENDRVLGAELVDYTSTTAV